MKLVLLAVFALAAPLAAADPALTIYNQNFAVVREAIPLDLRQGITPVEFAGATAFVEPESVILRDPSGKRVLRILEQNYRADPVSMESLLELNEGKTIEFLVQKGEKTEVVAGKIVRAGSTPAPWFQQQGIAYPPGASPVIEVDGKLRFQLPGVPLFPSLGGDTVLKPTLRWVIQSEAGGKLDAELAYVTAGMTWEADYNFVARPSGNLLDVVGWVTIENRSGKSFGDARIKLMAGDVNKVQPAPPFARAMAGMAGGVVGGIAGAPPVSEKTFDEYHLYELARATTLRDRETKQVEFVRAEGAKSELLYVYDGAKIDQNRYAGWQPDAIRQDAVYGTQSNPKVWVMREFVNSEANHLGMPLPKGRVRFYRRDTDGRLEFTGEDNIEHTPRDEKVRVFTGAAFDLRGERKRTQYRIDFQRSNLDEAFEIVVRNHKKEAVEVRVVEHMYRWVTWEIQTSSQPYKKTDSQAVEFRVQLQPGEEKTVTYSVHYTW